MFLVVIVPARQQETKYDRSKTDRYYFGPYSTDNNWSLVCQPHTSRFLPISWLHVGLRYLPYLPIYLFLFTHQFIYIYLLLMAQQLGSTLSPYQFVPIPLHPSPNTTSPSSPRWQGLYPPPMPNSSHPISPQIFPWSFRPATCCKSWIL
jgi:hypothetical protein